MKAALCILLLAAVAYAADEKKNEKRGLLGLGYGGHVAAAAPIISHGFYDHGIAAAAPLVSHGYYGHGLGLYGHGVAAAPLIGHGVSYSAPVYSASIGLGHGAIGLGHGAIGLGHGWH